MPIPTNDKREITPENKSVHDAGQWNDGIAIIGMSARFPRSRNVREFWEHLLAGEILISELSVEELRKAGVDDATLLNRDYVRRGNSIEGADCIDAEFFGLSRREAEITDPQQRVFLECAWESLEHAGYTGDGDRVGVFAGAGINTYLLQLLSNPSVVANAGGYQLMLANEKDYLATRVAYKLNLRGPAVAVQAACSTSLAAVHLACQSLLSGECDMALAGGVSIPSSQSVGYLYMPGMILSPDGYCRPFDAAAKGTVPSRGAGIVVLKRLSQALADEDRIYAVIRGSAWNNDGGGKVGYTAPSIDGQAAVIRRALAAAGVTADRLGYVEAHGTATELGDPIEVAALNMVFAESNAQSGSCVLGAVKANLGHADVAAGVAGLIKAALAVDAGVIPPTPNFTRPNPALELDRGPFVVSSSAMSWPDGIERWAGVSSYGIGGTNVHVVLSSAPSCPVHSPTSRPRIFPLSARTPAALAAACDHLANGLEADPTLAAEDVASTLQLGRREFPFRRAVVASDCRELATVLRKPPKSRDITASELAHDVVFLFPGQGQQFVGMAAALYQSDPVFRSTIEAGAEILCDECDFNVVELIAGSEKTPELKSQLADTRVAQPVLFLVEYALAVRWRRVGVEPSALLGHSLGELTAASVAGVFSFEDGLRLAVARGRLMSLTPAGIMLAVMLPAEKLAAYIEHDVWLAAENGPKMSVASGLVEPMEQLERRLAADRVASVRLSSKNAFHTPLMADAAKSFRQKVESVSRHAPLIPWLSNVTGTWINAAEAQGARYWGDQILARVRFTQNLAALAQRNRFLLEVGPGEALIGIARQQMPKSAMVPSLGAENRRSSDEIIFLEAAARAWECGIALSWQSLQPDAGRRRIPLPTYPFERQRYWIEPAAPSEPGLIQGVPSVELPTAGPGSADLTKHGDISSWFYAPSWQSTPPASVVLQQQGEPVDCWLVLFDRCGLAESIAAELRQKGATIITVAVSDRFTHSDDHFWIDPGQPGHYEQLWDKIGALGLRPAGLLNLWTMSGMNLQVYNSLLLLLQTAGRYRQRFRQIETIVDRLESLAGEAIEEVERAEVLGLLRVMAAEFPRTRCRQIDVQFSPQALDGIAQRMIARQILDEIQVPGPGLTIAYRGDSRWQKGWTPAPMRESASDPFRERGVYIITGGIGGIGYSIARYLLQRYNARVILTGRTELPPREQWAVWIAEHDNENSVSRRILRIQELEQLGGIVRFVCADVTDRAAMAKIIAQARHDFGEINGVLHTAGLPGGKMISSQDRAEAADVRRPKVQGSMVLAELLREERLDFFVLCSSVSAVIPAPGQSAYAAANVFQNYFAAWCQNLLKIPAVAIGFDAWQEIGMAAEMVLPEGFEHVKEERLRTAMSTAEGIEVIRRTLASWRGPEILTTTVSLDALLARASSEPSAQESHGVLNEENDPELAAVLEIWKDILANNEIAPTDNFFDLGGHSLMGIMVATRIRDRFGVELTLRTLFEAPTPQAVAEIIRASRQSAVEMPKIVSALANEREVFEF
jgi:phthiocerol/phenolphthiocerol synthesis type-I polyketide synthase E